MAVVLEARHQGLVYARAKVTPPENGKAGSLIFEAQHGPHLNVDEASAIAECYAAAVKVAKAAN